MNRTEIIQRLIEMLENEMPEARESYILSNIDYSDQRKLLRALMNIRPPWPLKSGFLELQDCLLKRERYEEGIVDIDSLFPSTKDKRLILWQGDITRLSISAIVNAANNTLLGCFIPCHGCIDNAIHSAAGLQLRDECFRLMSKQANREPSGLAKITKAYNLPCKHVIHTVGPIVSGELKTEQENQLKSCYVSCLKLAEKHDIESVAFCCISTGEYGFPNKIAAKIAVDAVSNYLKKSRIKHIVFNVFEDIDLKIYQQLI